MTRDVDTAQGSSADTELTEGVRPSYLPGFRSERHRDHAGSDDGGVLVSVTDLAQELGITARTLRFYEDKGLVRPRRVGAARVYANRERARMILILRGKKLGFSLREIKAYLDLYDADPRHEIQRQALLEKIADKRRQLEARRSAIDDALDGLDRLERDAATPVRNGTINDSYEIGPMAGT